MTYGAERLAHYIAAYDLSQQQMGERLGCTQDMVNRLIKGKRRPSLALAVRVEQQTEIPTSAWL